MAGWGKVGKTGWKSDGIKKTKHGSSDVTEPHRRVQR